VPAPPPTPPCHPSTASPGGRAGGWLGFGCDVRSIVYDQTGDLDVLRLLERPEPQPGPGEVLVRVAVSGVNPTDWKSRKGTGPGQPLTFPLMVPNQDGAGTVVDVGAGVDRGRIGHRVWIWEAAWQRAEGTAQELVVLPNGQAVPLPDQASFDLGASLGIPALTAHRCLTVGAEFADSLGPGALSGRTVLVAGGAGAVGHAAIELAVWADATVLTTVSSPEKEHLALAAGAHHVINYRTGDPAAAIREVAPGGADLIVEVAPVANAALNQEVLARNGTVAVFASGTQDLAIRVRPAMVANARYQFVLVYTVPEPAKQRAVHDVRTAVAAGALRVGAQAGLPLHRFTLERTADAHAAVENNTVGKVLIDVG
jgi:NADPH2:quinone reductase